MTMPEPERIRCGERFEELFSARRADMLNEISRICRARSIAVDDRLSPILAVLITHIAELEAERQVETERRVSR